MHDPATPADFERLFEHRAWVRALATRLCADRTAVDDLEQETWIQALRAGAIPASTRAWLGGIVRNLARRERTRDAARRTREEHAALREDLPSASDLLERAELQRRVLAALAALDEPHRVVVLLRYAEGLDGEEIAARLGVPGSTVRNRLARALEKLRAELDHGYGARSSWALVFTPALEGVGTTGLAVGGTLVKGKLALVGAAALLAAVAWWGFAEREDGAAASIATTAVSVPLDAGATVATQRASVIEPASGPSARTSAVRFDQVMLVGRLSGPRAEDLDEDSLVFRGTDGIARRASVAPDGSYSVFGVPPGRTRVAARAHGFVPFFDVFELGDDKRRVQRDLVLEPALVLPVRFTAPGGGALDLPSATRELLAAVATRERPERLTDMRGRQPSEYGVGMWRAKPRHGDDPRVPQGADGVLQVRAAPPVWVAAVLRESVLDARPLQFGERELVFEIDVAALRATLSTLELRAVDARTGAPLAGASVSTGYGDSWERGTVTDADGRFRRADFAPGSCTITIEAQGHAFTLREVRIPAGEHVDLGTIAIPASAIMRGRVVDPSGRPVAARVDAVPLATIDEPRALESHRLDRATADGEFSFMTDAARVRVFVRHEDWMPTFVDVDASAGTADAGTIRLSAGTVVEFVAPAVASGRVTFVVARDDGAPLAFGSAGPVRGTQVRLAPGVYEVRVIGEAGVVRTERLEVGADRIVHELGKS